MSSDETATPDPDFAAVDAYIAEREDASGIAEAVAAHFIPTAIPDEARQAIKDAVRDGLPYWLTKANPDGGMAYIDSARLDAIVDLVADYAMSVLRRHIADEIANECAAFNLKRRAGRASGGAWAQGFSDGLDHAARVVRDGDK